MKFLHLIYAKAYAENSALGLLKLTLGDMDNNQYEDIWIYLWQSEVILDNLCR